MRRLLYNDEITSSNEDRCELCGAVIVDGDVDKKCRAEAERLYRFTERLLWDTMSNKACGTIMRTLCATVLLPTASTRHISAVVGVTPMTVTRSLRWIEENAPEIYRAVKCRR